MATKKKSSKPANVVFTLPDPDGPPNKFQAEVGGTVTWKSETPNYPKFEVSFTGANPSDDIEDAKFSGASNQPVVLNLKTPGHYKYIVKHINKDGTNKSVGPFSIGIAAAGQFDNRCRGCP